MDLHVFDVFLVFSINFEFLFPTFVSVEAIAVHETSPVTQEEVVVESKLPGKFGKLFPGYGPCNLGLS